MDEDVRRGGEFRYAGVELRRTPAGPGTDSLELTCRYLLDGEPFVEVVETGPVPAPTGVGAAALTEARTEALTATLTAAARLVWLLAGVSYYKAGAPRRVLVDGGLTDRERDFLRTYYRHGLGEFAHVNRLDLADLVIEGARIERSPVAAHTSPGRPLIPFGGGIDSIVVVDETVRAHPDAALFVADTSDVPFEPIEQTAAITGLPVLRARRHLDPKILQSRQRGYLNGHVPVTGVLSAVAVLVAVAHGRDQVVMSNEHSASEPTSLVANGVPVNHQWSKGIAFETGFRELLAATVTGVDYFSALRPYSELWVSERFAALTAYHPWFRSCNRAFHVDAGARAADWCGECDKCCFIDLVLAPYLSRAALERVFSGSPGGEPLARPDLEGRFRDLLGEVGRTKPLECVGDEGECRRAVLLAAARPDRRETTLLHTLAAYVDGSGLDVPSEATLLAPQGPHFLPALLT